MARELAITQPNFRELADGSIRVGEQPQVERKSSEEHPEQKGKPSTMIPVNHPRRRSRWGRGAVVPLRKMGRAQGGQTQVRPLSTKNFQSDASHGRAPWEMEKRLRKVDSISREYPRARLRGLLDLLRDEYQWIAAYKKLQRLEGISGRKTYESRQRVFREIVFDSHTDHFGALYERRSLNFTDH